MEGLTKRGRRMKALIVERMVAVLSDPALRSASQKRLARLCRVSVRTFRDYLTEELQREVARAAEAPLGEAALREVDRAMLARARKGNVAAAKLLYARVAGTGSDGDGTLPTLEELVDEVKRLEGKKRLE